MNNSSPHTYAVVEGRAFALKPEWADFDSLVERVKPQPMEYGDYMASRLDLDEDRDPEYYIDHKNRKVYRITWKYLSQDSTRPGERFITVKDTESGYSIRMGYYEDETTPLAFLTEELDGSTR